MSDAKTQNRERPSARECQHCMRVFKPLLDNHMLCSYCVPAKICCLTKGCLNTFAPILEAHRHCFACRRAHYEERAAKKAAIEKEWQLARAEQDAELAKAKVCEVCNEEMHTVHLNRFVCDDCSWKWREENEICCKYTRNNLRCSNSVLPAYPNSAADMKEPVFHYGALCNSTHYDINNPKAPDAPRAVVVKKKSLSAAQAANKTALAASVKNAKKSGGKSQN